MNTPSNTAMCRFVRTPWIIGFVTTLLCLCTQVNAESAKSSIVYTKFLEAGPEVWKINEDGSGNQRLGSGSDASWSPDGQQLVYTLETGGNTDIYRMNSDGSGRTRVTSDPAEDHGGSWSPDGSMIAFNSDRSGTDQIWRTNVDKGNWGYNLTQLTQDTPHKRVNNFLAWSPDGRWLAFEADRDRDDPEIYLANAVDGTNQQRLTFTRALDEVPSWAPDGQQILFSSDMHDKPMSRNYDIYIMDVDGSNQQRLTKTTGAASYPSMSKDGSKIVYSYQASGDSPMQIWIMNSDGSENRLFLGGGGIPRYSPF